MPGMAVVPPPPDENRTRQLVRRLQDGDDAAWQKLYERYHDELLFSIRAGMGSRLRAFVESEDVLQSVAVEAFRELPRFVDRGPGSLRAFLLRLVRTKLADRGRAAAAGKRSGAVPLTPDLAEDLAGHRNLGEPRYFDDTRYGRLERALATLPADMREVVVLRRIEGCSCRDAAVRMQRSDEATRKLYSRAIARLTGLLQEPA
jgi:RNA polymerase sigma-70 factor (ECF subfamily)